MADQLFAIKLDNGRFFDEYDERSKRLTTIFTFYMQGA